MVNKMKFNWFWQAVISMVFFSAVTLLFKVLVDTKLKSEIINFYFFLFTTLGFLGFLLFRETTLKIPLNTLPTFGLLTLVALVANYYGLKALAAAPNPGYVSSIQEFKAVIVLIAAVFLFNSELSFTKGLGILFCFIGIILLSL
ncbi:MAG TPA: hypothetical protein EYP59_18545 [Thiotrichaceae bacterium]|nr:hypothetical protein [Thiotrichaceae bacterium]